MLVPASIRAMSIRLLAAAIVFVAMPLPSAVAQDGNDAVAAPAQPPAIAPARPAGLLKEPKLIVSAIDLARDKFGDGTGTPKSGFYPELSNMVTGAGWLAIGPGYRQFLSNGRVFIDGSAALSWHLYKMAQGRIELPTLADSHLVVGAQGMWQDETQVNYFGLGSDSTEDDRSQYRFQTHDIVGYAKYLPNSTVTINGEFGWLGRPKIMEPGGTFKGDFPDVREAYPTDPAVSLETQPSLLHSEAAITADTRNHRGYPTSGFVYRAALTQYTDRSGGTFSFREYEAEGLQLVPIGTGKWVLAFHGWTVHGDVPDGHAIPFYLLPALGGNNTLRAYSNFQFHENNLLVVNAESRLRLTPHIDMALFADAGNVAHDFGDLNLDKRAYGAGLRLHTDTTTVARMDVAHGDEGWRFVFRTTEPFRLARIRRQIAAMPFMP
jgi:surface antigen Omp85-like protein